MLIPTGYKKSFEAKSVFCYTAMPKFNIKMIIMKSFFPLIIYLLKQEMPIEYKAFFMMFSELVVDLMSPVVALSSIESLHNRAIEFVCLFQGLFPQTEHHMVFHFLIHLAKHIPVAGILKNWCSFGGERGNSFVKQFLSKGGANFELTMELKYYQFENQRLEKAYEFDMNEPITRSTDIGKILLSHKEFYIDNKNNNSSYFSYNPYRMLVYGEYYKSIEVPMSHYEASNFLDCLIKEIMKQCNSKEEAMDNSELFKLYCKHLELNEKYGRSWYRRINTHKTEASEMMFFDLIIILRTVQKLKKQKILTDEFDIIN
jgi:hypothetical protein